MYQGFTQEMEEAGLTIACLPFTQELKKTMAIVSELLTNWCNFRKEEGAHARRWAEEAEEEARAAEEEQCWVAKEVGQMVATWQREEMECMREAAEKWQLDEVEWEHKISEA
jgi:hypothetical protein